MSDVIDNKAHHRFELVVESHLAAAYYKLEGNVITFIHTEVPPELGGKASARGWCRARSIRSAPPA
jgi:predicted GNAT family acetyltransferase